MTPDDTQTNQASDREQTMETEVPARSLPMRQLTIAAALALLFVFAMFASFQRRLIYFPSKETPSLERAARAYRGAILPVTVAAPDGVSLNGWLLPASKTTAAATPRESVADDRLLLVWLPGNAGHRGHRLGDLALVADLGCHALIVDYRGYGENAGSPSEEAIAGDVRSVWRYAVEDLGKSPGQIVLMGESLGGGAAVRLMSDLEKGGTAPGGLVLRATFASLPDVAGVHYPWLPVSKLLVDRFPSIERIGAARCPVLIAHGTLDRIVPYEQGRRLFETAPARSERGIEKRFLELPDSDHNDILDANPELWVNALREFLTEVHSLSRSSAR